MSHKIPIRRVPVLIAGLFLMGIFVPLAAPPAAAQGAKEISFADGGNDVSLLNPAVPGTPATQVNGALDVKNVRLFGESGTSIILEVQFFDMQKEDLPPILIQYLTLAACFKWNDKPYAAIVKYRPAASGQIHSQWLTALDAECAQGTHILPLTGKSVVTTGNATLDTINSVITISIPRTTLGLVADGVLPKVGDSMGKLRVLTWDETVAQCPPPLMVVCKDSSLRYDAAPDAGPHADTLTLGSNTGGESTLSAEADPNIAQIVCGTRKDAPAYAFEAGGKRGIPMIFKNEGDQARDVLFTVETLSGKDWTPKIVPQLQVGPYADVGNVTVTIILDTPANTKHKDCAILRVRGTDKADPLNFAEGLVAAIAVRPPDPDNKRLYFHAAANAGDVCGAASTWLNTLEDDPADAKRSIAMKSCKDPAGAFLTTSNVQFTTKLDVNPNKDLVINTSATDQVASVTLHMRSDYVETRARMSVALVTMPRNGGDPDPIGEGRVDVTITTQGNAVTIPLQIGFTRDEVGTGDPSRILFSEDGLGLVVQYQPLPSDSTVTEASTAGHVVLSTVQTFIDLPVWATIKRNAADPGVSGALISLKPANALPQFAYPGAVRLFNFTVLNEGPESEVAVFEATFTGAKGWTARFIPGDTVPLAPGERKLVQAALTPPATANESESILFDVIVHSQKDPTARSSVAVKVMATREGSVPQEVAPTDAIQSDKGFLPAPGAIELLALVGLLGVAVRWRRR